MPTEIEIANALLAWAALDQARIHANTHDPRNMLTVRRAAKAHRAAVELLKKRGIFKTGDLFEKAQASWLAHLALNLAIYEADPKTRGYDACLSTGEVLHHRRLPKVRP